MLLPLYQLIRFYFRSTGVRVPVTLMKRGSTALDNQQTDWVRYAQNVSWPSARGL